MAYLAIIKGVSIDYNGRIFKIAQYVQESFENFITQKRIFKKYKDRDGKSQSVLVCMYISSRVLYNTRKEIRENAPFFGRSQVSDLPITEFSTNSDT